MKGRLILCCERLFCSMALKELIEIKFRLADGNDIGPNKYTPSTTVASLKEKIIAQWPEGFNFL